MQIFPIVGGSILSHDHFQGGHYTFAMEKAPVIQEFTVKGFEDVTAGIVKWPLSVIRLQSEDVTRVIDLADHPFCRHGEDIQMKLLSFLLKQTDSLTIRSRRSPECGMENMSWI